MTGGREDTSAQVDPERLTVILEDAGWKLVGGRHGLYNRLSPPHDTLESTARSWTLLVPLDRDDPAFPELMAAALVELRQRTSRDMWLTEVTARLRPEPTDSFHFRKQSSAPEGLISWRQGEDLIASARATLIAGAKAYREPLRRFGNRLGQFASRYLDTVLMGQTGVGSYIVTAYAPANAQVPLQATRADTFGLPEVDYVESRSITTSVSKSIEATVEALTHFRTMGSMLGFESSIDRGVSYELTSALQSLTRDSDGADVRIEWDPAEIPEGSSSVETFEFKGSDSAVLETAANRLAETEHGPIPTTITGRVHLLTKKQEGGPGVFGLESISSPPRKYRIRLADPEQYHLAVRAHDEDMALQVFGTLEPEGSFNWIYNATVQRTFRSIEEARASIREGYYWGASPAQLSFVESRDNE